MGDTRQLLTETTELFIVVVGSPHAPLVHLVLDRLGHVEEAAVQPAVEHAVDGLGDGKLKITYHALNVQSDP